MSGTCPTNGLGSVGPTFGLKPLVEYTDRYSQISSHLRFTGVQEQEVSWSRLLYAASSGLISSLCQPCGIRWQAQTVRRCSQAV